MSPFGFSLSEVDSHPSVLRRVQPVYPETARSKKITGRVLLRFLLTENGDISHLHVKYAEPRDVFDNVSLAAVRQWRFAPARKDGRAVPVWVELPMQFDLR